MPYLDEGVTLAVKIGKDPVLILQTAKACLLSLWALSREGSSQYTARESPLMSQGLFNYKSFVFFEYLLYTLIISGNADYS